MSITLKAWAATIGIGLVLYSFAIFYAWKFAATGSKTVFLSAYAAGCGITALGMAGLCFVLVKTKWPAFTPVAVIVALILFLCVAVAMFYGMLNW